MKKLTNAEIKDLINNPFVIKATKYKVVFTKEFEKMFLSLVENQEYTLHKAFKILGINPVALGENRVQQLYQDFINNRNEAVYKGVYYDDNSDIKKEFKTIQEELDFYKRKNAKLKRSLLLLIQMDQLDKNYKPILSYLE